MHDDDEYRSGVGIMLANDQGQLLWARRIGQQDAWQFPQGGIDAGESPEQALYRELQEEVGLPPEAVRVIDRTDHTLGWLRYRFPDGYVHKPGHSPCIGQKQVWFLLHLLAEESAVRLDCHSEPEFDEWRWVSYWHPLSQIVAFKREVYRQALSALAQPCAQIYNGGG